MEPIRIISNVDEDGRLHIPEGLTLKKGRVEVIIKHLDGGKEKNQGLSFSDHYCGRVLVERVRREDIYGDDGR